MFTAFKREKDINDITSLDFFETEFSWDAPSVPSRFLDPDLEYYSHQGPHPLNLSDPDFLKLWPNIWFEVDRLAKSYYSSILLDLGQTNPSSNMLLNETALKFYLQEYPTLFKNETLMDFRELTSKSGVELSSSNSDDFTSSVGNLSTSPSVIRTKYLCQVPKKKSPGSIIISILVADIVLMQALWKLFNFIISTWLTHRHVDGKLTTIPYPLFLSFFSCELRRKQVN
jgi:hypothetical protein